MPHSTVTRKGQTTIPGEVRKALRIKPGDRLEYVVEGDSATIHLLPPGHPCQQEGKGNDICPNPKSRR
jgi:AbrB family looped-hinge helix DNA binding protein